MSRTFVIAEAAACHDGSLEQAHRLINLAAEIGADACKFQWLSSPERLVARRGAPGYLHAYRLLSFPRAWFEELRAACAVHGLAFMCTAYLPEDVSVVAEYVARFKVASFEAMDIAFVGLHGNWPGTPLVISAGMGADLTQSLRGYRRILGTQSGWLERRENIRVQVSDPCVLACTSAYPCPDGEAGLRRVGRSVGGGDYQIRGYSDHTRHPWTGALAVAAGAEIVEFHIRLDDTSPTNADYTVARTPAEAAEYVRNLRQAEAMLGEGGRGVMPAEAAMLRYRVTDGRGSLDVSEGATGRAEHYRVCVDPNCPLCKEARL